MKREMGKYTEWMGYILGSKIETFHGEVRVNGKIIDSPLDNIILHLLRRKDTSQ